MLDNEVSVRMNMMMMEKFKINEARQLEPIDLDKLNELSEYVDHKQDWDDDTLGGVLEKVSDDVMNDVGLTLLVR
ncbi:hypothetical protein SO802_021846 [Lithocarpus litseifolius]|uniref:Uncharacterized protein n=1 Tax=Lithocarpus litseifolius TaxID=425828 RepID=A0AAW2CG51_9ROSI